jgi:uncharacterized protein (DUF885 family)
MRRSWHVVYLGCLGLIIAVVATVTAQESTFPARSVGVTAVTVRQLFADYWRWHLAAEPGDATRAGVHTFDDRWRDWSKAGRAATHERRQEFLRNLQYAGLGNLTTRERLSLSLLERRLAFELAADKLLLLSRLSPGGAHNEVFLVVAGMPTGSVADYERVLARIRAFPAYVDQHIELWGELLADGFAQPASVVDGVAAAIDAQREAGADQSPLLEAFRRFPASIPAAERARLEREAVKVYVEEIAPAWERLGRYLRESSRPRGRGNPGIADLPDGPAQYKALLGYYGAPTEAVDPLHEQAAADAARLLQRAPGVLGGRGDADAANHAANVPDPGAPVPEFRRHLQLPAFHEGWSVFEALRLSSAAFAPGDEPWRRAVTLAHEATVKATLDSGLHVLGWSRAQALSFAGSHLGAVGANDLVDTVAATPGRALAVYAGARRFADIRRAAEARLGERFDERAFVRAALDSGALMLDLVDRQVDEVLALFPAEGR